MSRIRIAIWTLLVAGGFALAAAPAYGQNPLPKRPDTANIIAIRDTPRGGIPKENLKAAKEDFAKFAKYYADVIAHPDVWKASQDFKLDAPGVRIPTIDNGPNGILPELDRFLIEPMPVSSKPNLEPGDYIRELGAAFDAALKPLIETHPETIVRVNAARVLAHVARTGAPAHFPTITGLLANANTRTEVKYYLFNAAGAVLSANDPYDIKIRKHAVDPKIVAELVKTLDDCVNTPAMLVTGLPVGKPEEITPDQLAVIGVVRRQAVRALAQTKFASYPTPDGKSRLYPAATLARIAVSDPAFAPAPGPAECAEAVIGLCNMAPVEEKGARFIAVKEYNGDVAAEAVLAGLVTFAKPRAGNAFDRSLAWRTYSVRLAEALRNWRPLFDPDYDILQPTKFDPKSIPAPVEVIYKEVVPKVLAPMDKVDGFGKLDTTAKVEIEDLMKRLADARARPNRNTLLFKGVDKSSIEGVKKIEVEKK